MRRARPAPTMALETGPARAEALRVGELPEDVELDASRASASPFASPDFARAFAAAGDEALLVRVLREEAVLAHAWVLETRAHGFASWSGLGAPVLRPHASAVEVWSQLLRAARARDVVSASWRDLTLTRLDDAALAAATSACEALGGLARVMPFLARRLDVMVSTEALWAGLHRKHRNAVRAAEAAGVEAGPAPRQGFVADYAPLSAATWARSGRGGAPEAYYACLVASESFVPYLARDAEGAPVAGAIVAVGGEEAVYLHGASVPDAPGASTLLQWRILQDLHARGIRSYDLGGDVAPGAPDDTPRAAGIRRFKERFGGEARVSHAIHLQLDPEAYARAKAAMAAARAP